MRERGGQGVSASNIYLKVKSQLIDGYCLLARVVLYDPGQECLREVEPRYPEHHRLAALIPALMEYLTRT